jgi:hypothetical protein
MAIIPVLGRLRQEFKASQGNIVCLRPVWATIVTGWLKKAKVNK